MITRSQKKAKDLKLTLTALPDGNKKAIRNPTTTYQNPLLYHHILVNTLQYLDSGSLKWCRLACKQWNEFAIRELAKQSIITLEGPNQRFKEFQSILAKFPKSLFQNAIIDCHWLQKPAFKKWLASHGTCLKFLKVNAEFSGMNTKLLDKVLTNWCQNLESLSLFIEGENLRPWQHSEEDCPRNTFTGRSRNRRRGTCDYSEHLKVEKDSARLARKPLKLKSVHLNGATICKLSNFAFSILEDATKLEILHTRNTNDMLSCDLGLIYEFYDRLAKTAKVLINLVELRWDDSYCDARDMGLDSYCKIFKSGVKLNEKFKVLGVGTLGIRNEYAERYPSPNDEYYEELTGALLKVAASLETLILDGEYGLIDSINTFKDALNTRRKKTNWPAKFPSMKEIKLLANKRFLEMRVQDLQKFPALEILELGCSCDSSLNRGFVDLIFDRYNNIADNPDLKQLQVLRLKQQVLNPSTFQSIGKCFPELSELWITKDEDCSKDMSLNKIVKAIYSTSLKNVKRLKVYFDCRTWDKDELRNGLASLKKFRELEELTLYVQDSEILDTGGLSLALEPPKLRSFKLGSENGQYSSIWDYLNALHIPDERNIHLGTVGGSTFLCCDGRTIIEISFSYEIIQ